MPSTQKQAKLKRWLYLRALFESFLKLDPRQQIRHPVMFAIEAIGLLLTGLWLWVLIGGASVHVEVASGTVALWLGLTVLLTNFAEALAEARSKAQAESPDWPHHSIKIKWLKLPPPGD